MQVRPPNIQIGAPSIGAALVAGFVGSDTKYVGRLRGGRTSVAPLSQITNRWEAWIGFNETWNVTTLPRYRFGACNLTVFLSQGGIEPFYQILRAEWTGPEESGKDIWSFRPDDAGHPHWQIDVPEMLFNDLEISTARELLRDTAPREFGAAEMHVKSERPPYYKLGSMHFASGMRPWSDDQIAYGPKQLREVRSWVINTIRLLRLELDRL
jgi:hypothetical protein